MPLTLHDKLFFKLKSAYLRITLTRFTAAFFLFGFIHCLVQGIINGMLFSVDARSLALVTGIAVKANVQLDSEFAWFRGHRGNRRLDICYDIPLDLHGKPEPCRTVFKNSDMLDQESYPPALVMNWDALASVSISALAVVNDTDTSVRAVKLVYDQGRSSTVLNPQCSQALMYARQVLKNAKREDITTVAFQFWLFAISFIAVMYDSVPHTIAILIARALITGWSAFAIWRTTNIKHRFSDLFIDRGTACGVDFGFGQYFEERLRYEIPDLLLNVTALCISCYLSNNLLEMYNKQTFKCVGVSAHIVRMYRFFMAKLVCLQLCVFVLLASMCLWIDQLFNSSVATISEHTPEYKSLFYCTTALLLPWLISGWLAVRKEMRILMAIHGFVTAAFIVSWSIMFVSQVYRWTYVEWPFVACMTTASFILLVASLVIGSVCWFNFDKGLKHYLYVEDKLASVDFEAEIFPHAPRGREHEERKVYYVPTLHSGDGFQYYLKEKESMA